MKSKRKYDRSFKERAVRLSYERENIKELALELGISSERIYKWRSEYRIHGESSFSGHGVERLSE
ncbi:MAG: transposase [Bacteroidales bacterium]|jgi:transposase|nr:transposase [Bacteroidales bacterium]